MDAIITFISSLLQGIFSIIQMAFWLLEGMHNYGTVLLGSLNILTEVMMMLPSVVASAITAACAVLVTLRIIGRS